MPGLTQTLIQTAEDTSMRKTLGTMMGALLWLLAGCGGSPAPDTEDSVLESAGRKRGWFYSGLSEHPREAFAHVDSLAWREPVDARMVVHVWLSSVALDAEQRQRLMAQAQAGSTPRPAEALGIPGVLVRFDEQGRRDGLMTDFCPRRMGQVQCLSMSGVGSVVVTALTTREVEGALYTYDSEAGLAYVSPFATLLQGAADAPPLPAGLQWLGPGGGLPGVAYRERNQAARTGDVEVLVQRSMPDMATFLAQPGNAALVGKLALHEPVVLGGSQLDDVATLFVRAPDNAVLRVDLVRIEGQWRVQTTRP